jgi:hypothetical protein
MNRRQAGESLRWAAAVATLLAGCASTRLDAQWSDPQLTPNGLRGARVMVACEAYDLVVKQLCTDQLMSEVVARGATPVSAPELPNATPGRALPHEQYLSAAREAGAKAVLTHAITVDDVSAGSGFSIGIGGFGVGGGGVGGGVGVSMPVGGGRSNTGYAMNARATETANGRLLWTAKASASPSSDVSGQITELTRAVFGAADKAQLF